MARKGFTLFELLAVIAIIGLVATVIVPNLGKRSPSEQRRATLAKLNGLTQLAWKNALISNELHKVKFNLKDGIITVEKPTGQYKEGQPVTKPLERDYANSDMQWPERLEVKQFIIEGTDEIKVKGRSDISAWFFIMPDGLAQDVIINFVDTKDLRPDGQPKKFSLVLNPFNAQFSVYDAFQK